MIPPYGFNYNTQACDIADLINGIGQRGQLTKRSNFIYLCQFSLDLSRLYRNSNVGRAGVFMPI